MSAIFTAPASSLVKEVTEYSKEYQELKHFSRAAARMILNALDSGYPASEERLKVRKSILDALAWHEKEVERWVSSRHQVVLNKPSNGSTDSPPN